MLARRLASAARAPGTSAWRAVPRARLSRPTFRRNPTVEAMKRRREAEEAAGRPPDKSYSRAPRALLPVVTFTRLMEKYADRGEIENMEKVLAEMERRKLTPGAHTYAVLFRAYAEAGDTARCAALLDYADWDGAAAAAAMAAKAAHGGGAAAAAQAAAAASPEETRELWQSMFAMLVHQLGQAGDAAGIAALFPGLYGRCTDPDTWKELLRACCVEGAAGSHTQVAEAYRAMLAALPAAAAADQDARDLFLYATAVSAPAEGAARAVEREFERLVGQGEAFPAAPTVTAPLAVLHAVQRDAGDPAEAEAVLLRLHARLPGLGVRPDLNYYRAAAAALEHLGRAEAAVELLDAAGAGAGATPAPSTETGRALAPAAADVLELDRDSEYLNSLARAALGGRADGAGLLAALAARGVPVAARTALAVVRPLLEAHEGAAREEAWALLGRMADPADAALEGPDGEVLGAFWSALREGRVAGDDEKLLRVFESIVVGGAVPSPEQLDDALRVLVSRGDYDNVAEVALLIARTKTLPAGVEPLEAAMELAVGREDADMASMLKELCRQWHHKQRLREEEVERQRQLELEEERRSLFRKQVEERQHALSRRDSGGGPRQRRQQQRQRGHQQHQHQHQQQKQKQQQQQQQQRGQQVQQQRRRQSSKTGQQQQQQQQQQQGHREARERRHAERLASNAERRAGNARASSYYDR